MNDAIKSIVEKYQDIPDFHGINISSIDTKNAHNDQLLHVASVNNDKESVEELLKAGADINAKGENGFTPLHYAVEQGNYNIVNLLIYFGANKSVKNEFNETALDLAVNLDESEIEKFLKKYHE